MGHKRKRNIQFIEGLLPVYRSLEANTEADPTARLYERLKLNKGPTFERRSALLSSYLFVNNSWCVEIGFSLASYEQKPSANILLKVVFKNFYEFMRRNRKTHKLQTYRLSHHIFVASYFMNFFYLNLLPKVLKGCHSWKI